MGKGTAVAAAAAAAVACAPGLLLLLQPLVVGAGTDGLTTLLVRMRSCSCSSVSPAGRTAARSLKLNTNWSAGETVLVARASPSAASGEDGGGGDLVAA